MSNLSFCDHVNDVAERVKTEEIKKAEALNAEAVERYVKQAATKSKKIRVAASLIVILVVVAIITLSLITKVIVSNNKYKAAKDLLIAGNYVQAYEDLLKLNGYRDSSETADAIFEDYFEQAISNVSRGDVVHLGKYNDINLTWTVADVRKGHAILVCNTLVAWQPYNTEPGGINEAQPAYRYNEWPKCSLRTWLNSEFLNDAFGDKEQSRMMQASVPNAGKHKREGTASDYVYILSRAEMDASVDAGWDSDGTIRKNPLWLRGSSGTNGLSANAYSVGSDKITFFYGIVPVIWVSADSDNVSETSAFSGTGSTGKSPSSGSSSNSSGSSSTKCNSCGGSGKKLVEWYSEGNWGMVSYTSYACPSCGGTGRK